MDWRVGHFDKLVEKVSLGVFEDNRNQKMKVVSWYKPQDSLAGDPLSMRL
jgi:hypothetical protein